MDKEILQRDWTVKKLISFIDKDFYKKITNRYDLIKFTKLIVDTFCEEHDVDIVELVPARKTSSTFAQYNYNNIEVNNRYYKCFDDMREQNNFYFVAHYFNSIFHELRHHLQYSTNLKNASGILKNYIRLNKNIVIPESDKNPFGKYSYFCSPEELDARHYAYSLLIKNKTLAPYFRHGEYIEEEINNEVDYPMDYVKLLKDKKLRGYKFASLPLKNLEKEIKEIAKLNNLIYVGQGSKKSKSPFKNRNEKRANNLYLSLAINEKIAPLFNSPQFTEKTNGPRVESRIDDEMIEFFMKFEPSFVIEFKIDENDKEQETPSDEQETDKSSD